MTVTVEDETKKVISGLMSTASWLISIEWVAPYIIGLSSFSYLQDAVSVSLGRHDHDHRQRIGCSTRQGSVGSMARVYYLSLSNLQWIKA